MAIVEAGMFEEVGEIVRSLCAGAFDDLRMNTHRYGIKVWFGPEKPTRGHYEAQVLQRRKVDGKEGLCLEIGFHSEHRTLDENEAELKVLTAQEKKWRKQLGKEATAGEFFDADVWRRLSDVWFDPDLHDSETPFEIASRLADYLLILEPIRRS